jgi:hypothetical protein
MSSEIIPCPACQHPVRVPESLFGQPVRCPQCKAYFTAPLRDAEGNFGTPVILEEPPQLPEVTRPVGPKPTMSQSPVFVPGLFLMLVGMLGTLVNGYQAIDAWRNPDGAKERVIEALKMYSKWTKQEFKEDDAKQIANAIPTVFTIMFGVSLVPVFGAIAMLRLRMWWLAFLGSSVDILNVANGCCLIGLPAGIWCLIKLLDPEIRSLFSRSRPGG